MLKLLTSTLSSGESSRRNKRWDARVWAEGGSRSGAMGRGRRWTWWEDKRRRGVQIGRERETRFEAGVEKLEVRGEYFRSIWGSSAARPGWGLAKAVMQQWISVLGGNLSSKQCSQGLNYNIHQEIYAPRRSLHQAPEGDAVSEDWENHERRCKADGTGHDLFGLGRRNSVRNRAVVQSQTHTFPGPWTATRKLIRPLLSFLHRPDGKKKAYIKLTPDQDALDVSNKIGFI